MSKHQHTHANLPAVLYCAPSDEMVAYEIKSIRAEETKARQAGRRLAYCEYHAADDYANHLWFASEAAELSGRENTFKPMWKRAMAHRDAALARLMTTPAGQIRDVRFKQGAQGFLGGCDAFRQSLADDERYFATELARIANRPPRGKKMLIGTARELSK